MKKKCTKCGKILDLVEFSKGKNRKDGLQYECKECVSKYDRERNASLKLEAINAFGGRCAHIENGIQCPKNSIDDLGDLDLMHPNGDGDEHRDLISNGRGSRDFYQALKERGYDTDGHVVQAMCRSHHLKFDKSGKKHHNYGKYGKLNPKYKKGKFNNKDWLKKKYETMTAQEIADECGVCHLTIMRRMIRFNISRRKPGQRP